MRDETVTPSCRASKSKGRGTSSHRTQPPSDSKSNRRDTYVLCPLCGEGAKRGQESRRHFIDKHLPDWLCCPASSCSWHGSREDTLYNHIRVCASGCGAKPDLGEFKIYDPKLVLHWYLDSTPFETVESFALDLIEERARELGKVDAWGSLAGWRKQTTQTLIKM